MSRIDVTMSVGIHGVRQPTTLPEESANRRRMRPEVMIKPPSQSMTGLRCGETGEVLDSVGGGVGEGGGMT